ncbi:GNAT family N-acetyltransferase [Butyrivibrio sp. XPD2006]|jgi:spore coat polysaccharide biosynthesis protein SpsF|uniref:GNAT family N-acetyltransferase n=1 Tax=Butyrivibrio sp. XPD2006 TaxID=1280668 RepID=UPI0003B79CD8|nr:GNAT family N-acetyltransferase [Butyrivibrio sp. XPD2006]
MALFLRNATIEDAQDVFNWRNDPTTRANSFNKDEIDLESHMLWFGKRLGRENTLMYILMNGNKKVGNIRIDIEGTTGEISYMIAPEARGKGYGKKILALLEKTLSESEAGERINRLSGSVLKGNRASCRCFLANGYSETEQEDSYFFTKEI